MKVAWLFVSIFFLSLSAFSQQKEGANWLFGGAGATPGNHLNFNQPSPSVQPFSYLFNSYLGVATISDKNGQLLFFSSQGQVATRQKINNSYQQMPNGNLAIQFAMGRTTISELIAQNPANANEYYIFFVTGGGLRSYHDLYYAKVDMRLNYGFGDVVPNSLQLVEKNVAAGMAAMLHANNQDTWLLSYNVHGDSLRSYLLNSNGLQAPVITTTNKSLAFDCRMKSSPNSETFVATNNQNGVELFSFNRATGTVAPLHSLNLLNPTEESGVAYAFSPDSKKLYAGTKALINPPGNASVIQFDLDHSTQQLVQQSAQRVFQLLSHLHTIYDMQLAIDGKIYIAKTDSIIYLSRINYPDQAGINCTFEKDAIPLHSFTMALPALNQTIFRNAGLLQAQAMQDTICLGDSVQLSAYGAGMERFQWQPANGLSAPSDTLANPVVRPTATTTYVVTGSNPYQSKTSSVTVTVLPKPATVAISGASSVCPQVQNVWYQAQNPQQQQITWGIRGGTIATASNDSLSVNWGNAGNGAMVWAISKNRLGCTGDTTFFPVNINVVLATEKPAGADTLCMASAQNIAYRIQSTTGSVYNWGISGGGITAGQGTAAIQVNWSQPGIGKLWVHEESQTSTSLCRGLSDTLRVLIHGSPASLTVEGPTQVFTLAENQEYRLQNADNTSSFTWSVSGGEITGGQGSSSIKVNWNGPGTGSIRVTEMNEFGCPGKEAIYSVQVSGSPQLVFYNIITPNNDGRNDAFVIENLKWYPENELQIFNRWGTEVYRNSNYKNDWHAENLSSGVYFYYFRANGLSWKGWVEVVK